MNPVLKGYLRLCRPPNLPTAAADILAGLALGGFFVEKVSVPNGLLLVFSSVFLYAGGVALNDVFDYELDKIERPERPIPSGIVPYKKAQFFGFFLLGMGVILAALVNTSSALVALLLAAVIVIYDAFSKNFSFWGPLNMGVCRGLNLLLGMSILQDFSNWWYCFIPILFIFAVTLISRGEVHGNNKKNIILAAILYVLVISCVLVLNQMKTASSIGYLPFLALFALMVFIPLVKAYKINAPKNVMKAVKAGVLSIILLDVAMASAHVELPVLLGMLLLLPLSIGLAKAFAVT